MPKLNFGPRIKKFALRPPELDSFINILEGSVRSGKTWAMIPKILYLCRSGVPGWKVISGVSKQTIFNNVLNDLFNIVGPSNYSYNAQSGLLRLCGSTWMVIGAKDEGSEKYIRGMTAGCAIVDELTQIPQSFYEMLLTRLSSAGAKFYATTNTDNPNHWLKKEVLDNEKLTRSGDLYTLHCTMDDNPNLSRDYIERQKRLYSGLFYKRMILGLWVVAEGTVFGDAWSDDLFYDDSDVPVGLYGAGGYQDHIIACDYGTANPCVFLEGIDDGETLWFDREYYWDSAKEQRQKTDQEYGADLVKFIKESNIRDARPRIVLDPSAASFQLDLNNRGLWVVDADNEVIEGIKTVNTVLSQRKVRFHRRCTNTIREFPQYAWDERAAAKGEEKPIKKDDHGVDAGRYGIRDIFKSWRIAA
jgi:PBSX family phage terminase large subunit